MRTNSLSALTLVALALSLSACATGPTGCYTLPTTEERVACLQAEAAYSAARHADYRAAAESGRRALDDAIQAQNLFNSISNRYQQPVPSRSMTCSQWVGGSVTCQ